VLLYRRQLARLFLRRRLGAALRELDEAYRSFQAAGDRNAAGLQLLQSFNAVLKRVALVHFGFLDARFDSADFTVGAGQPLGDGIYRPVFDADAEALHALCRRWVERCYLQPRPKAVASTGPAANAAAHPASSSGAQP
jgi:hypothetical protein